MLLVRGASAGLICVLVSACGAAPTRAATTPPASLRRDEEFPLDPPSRVAGTGVTMQPPRGSAPSPVGAGFVHNARRVQMIVAAAEGDGATRAAFRRGIEAEAEVLETEDVTVAGVSTTLIVDHQERGDLTLERVWTLVERGDRAFVVGGMYDASRAERVRGLVRASVLATTWDPTEPLDPEVAMGYGLTPGEGLSLDRSTTGSIAYRESTVQPTPPGEALMYLVALPGTIPFAQRDEACEAVLVQAGPIPDERVETRSRIETDAVEGCEVTGSQPAEGTEPALTTYGAIVFVGDAIYLVAGAVDAQRGSMWLPRFSAAARTVQATR